MMGSFPEERALEACDQCPDSLEEKISMFYGDNSGQFYPSSFHDEYDDDDESDNCGGSHDQTQRTEYWESQESMLQEILDYNSLTGSKLRRQISQALEMARETALCHCTKPSSDGCNSCLRRAVVDRLCENGFNAALCTSKWKSTSKTPGGKHEYIDVNVSGLGQKKETRFLIEVELRTEFEMAKACDEYRKLINKLPNFYVGKPEQLNAIVRVVCDAAKRSMKEMKIHIGPWRKRSFMQMKWLGPYQRLSSNQSSVESISSSRKVHMPIHTYFLQFSAPTALEVT